MGYIYINTPGLLCSSFFVIVLWNRIRTFYPKSNYAAYWLGLRVHAAGLGFPFCNSNREHASSILPHRSHGRPRTGRTSQMTSGPASTSMSASTKSIRPWSPTTLILGFSRELYFCLFGLLLHFAPFRFTSTFLVIQPKSRLRRF